MLWGRDIELELLKRILGERIPSGQSSRLYVIEGTHGMGKTAVLSELMAYLRTLPRPMILLEVPGFATVAEGEQEAHLLQSLATLGFAMLERMEDEGWRSYFTRLLTESIPEMPEVLLVVDGYEKLTPPKKVFLKENVLDILKGFALSHDARFVLTSAQELPHAELEAFWPGLAAQRVPLPPLGPESLKEWLRAAHEPTEEIVELRQKTEGVPLKVEEYLKDKRDERMEALAKQAEATILAGKGEKERKILAVAALAEEVDAAILDYFLGEGDKNFLWLTEASGVAGLRMEAGFKMLDEPREQLKAWISRRDPRAYSDTLLRLQGLKTMERNFSGSRERWLLGNLAQMKYFSMELLEKFFAEDCEEVMRYLRAHAEMFAQEGELWSLKEDYAQAAQMAAEMISKTERESLMQRLSELWRQRKEQIVQEMETAERTIVEDRESMNKATRDLEQIEPKMNSMISQIEALKRTLSPLVPNTQSIQDGWNTAGVAFVVIGIIWIYVSVLTSSALTVGHCATGAFLILVGLSAPHVGRSHATAMAATPAEEVQAPEVVMAQKSLHYVQMRFTALDHKKRMLSGRIADNRHKIEALEDYLQKPYL